MEVAMSSVTGPMMDPQGRAQEALLRGFEEVSRSSEGKRCFLVKKGEEYQEIEAGSKMEEAAKRWLYGSKVDRFPDSGPGVWQSRLRALAGVADRAWMQDLQKALEEESDRFKELFGLNIWGDLEKTVTLYEAHYKRRAELESSAAFKQFKEKLAAQEYFKGQMLLKATYQEYDSPNRTVDYHIRVELDREREFMKRGERVPRVPLTVGKVIFLLHFLPDNEFEFQKEALRLATEALERFKVAEDSLTVFDPLGDTFDVEDLLLMRKILKAIHSLEPRKIDEAMKPLVEKLETIQRELEKKYEAEMPRLIRREIRWLEQVQAGYQQELNSLKKYRVKMQDLQQVEQRALEVRDQIAQFDFNLLPPLPISVREFESFPYQENTRLPCLRNLQANSSDQKAFIAALLENRDKLGQELLQEMLEVELQILAEKLSGIVPGESSNREYLRNLNREAFDRLGDKLRQDVENSTGSSGTAKEEAVRRFANYTQNYSEIRAILEEKDILQKHIEFVGLDIIELLQERQLRLEASDSKASPEEVNRRLLLCALNKICLKVFLFDEKREVSVDIMLNEWHLKEATENIEKVKRIHAEYQRQFPNKTKTKTE
jgi:competence protein ComGF